MRYYLIFIVLSISYLFVNTQPEDSSTTNSLVQNVTEKETTVVPTTGKTTEHTSLNQTTKQMNFGTTTKYTNTDQTTQHTSLEQTIEQKSFDQTTKHTIFDQTTVISDIKTTTSVSNKVFVSSYVEPPPHPLGYCIRSRLRCSKIRRCCTGTCNVIRMRCP
ncbi:unnamed protein product [Rotaria sp. Silwood2]|nr:unnamed protein product [Rotaria sp. Silwood2]CAF2511537.1 unnamed protein product [Rotaria sp. Silwood2]CAF2744534.1 unnamed protein product [Rotaria sp. Silwood2]CAF2887571.1 unnamed protein product [Rotaria sp. Silwood2]CAF3881227.1 unnamed protein product [Rotaria sp. Silwood2]